jgi:hypothetical protein
MRSEKIDFCQKWNLDLGVAARGRGGNCGGDSVDVLPNTRPLGAAGENHEPNAARAQVLLVANAPVGREQHVKAGILCGLQASRC